MHSLVTFVFLYDCESLTLTEELQRRIHAMTRKCYCRIPFISNKDHVTNEEVRAKIQRAIGPHEDLMIIVRRHKLQEVWTSLPFIRSGTVERERRRRRQKKRWEDSIREWTGLEPSPRGQWRTEKCRKLVVKSSVVPQRPWRLKNM